MGRPERPRPGCAVNGNRKPRICDNRKLHTSGEDVSGGADILPVMPVGRFGLDAGSGSTGVLANTHRWSAGMRYRSLTPAVGLVPGGRVTHLLRSEIRDDHRQCFRMRYP